MSDTKRTPAKPPQPAEPSAEEAARAAVEDLRRKRDTAAASGDAALTAHIDELLREAERQH